MPVWSKKGTAVTSLYPIQLSLHSVAPTCSYSQKGVDHATPPFLQELRMCGVASRTKCQGIQIPDGIPCTTTCLLLETQGCHPCLDGPWVLRNETGVPGHPDLKQDSQGISASIHLWTQERKHSRCRWSGSLQLTCAPGVAEVTLDHAAGLAIPVADATAVFFGCRSDDAITADFLGNQRVRLSVCV